MVLSRHTLFVILIMLFSGSAEGQELLLKQYTVNDGLPSNEVYQVEEGKYGELLIATDRGVVQYDGYNFQKLYTGHKSGTQPVVGIYKAPSGKTYFYGSNEIVIYINDTLYSYPYNHLIIPRRFNTELITNEPTYIHSLSESRDSLWMVFSKPGAGVITPDGHSYYLKEKGNVSFDLVHGVFVKSTSAKNYQETWSKVYITWPDGTQSIDSVFALNTDGIRKLQHVKMGELDIFLVKDILFIYKNKIRVRQCLLPRMPLNLRANNHDKLWICYENGGARLYSIDMQGLDDMMLYALPGISVSNIFFDFQGGIWFSTLENGLYYASPDYFRVWSFNDRISIIRQIHDRAIINYYTGTIRIFRNGALDKTITLRLKKDEVLFDSYFFTDDAYYYVTNLGVYYRYLSTTSFFSFFVPVSAPILTPYRVLFPFEDNSLYIGHFTGKTNKLHRFYTNGKAQGIVNIFHRTLSMLKDDSGNVWYGTFDKLYKRKNDVLYTLTDKNSLLQARFTAIDKLVNGWIVMSTQGKGLLLYNYRYNKLVVLNEDNGLPTNVLNKMQVVNDTIWLGTNKGIIAVTFINGKFNVHTYDKAYRLPTIDIRDFCIAGNYLYFRGNGPLYTVNLNDIRRVKPLKKPIITSVKVNNKPVNYLELGTFEHSEKDISIQFKCINFERSNYQVYRYRLKGNSDNWYTTSERQILFTNLQPGKYDFELQAVDANGQYIDDTAIYGFTIHPPFWETIWFYTLVTIAILLLAILIVQLRLNAIKKRNVLLLSLAEYQQKALVQQMSPHFIYNIVNTAQSAMINDNKMQAITILARFTRLMRLSLDLSREKTVLLEKEITMLKKYLELEMVRFPDKFTYNIDVVRGLDANNTFIPGMLMQPFVENAIKHGISHLSGIKGHIEIMLRLQDDMILFSVEDNGIGRTRSTVINSNRVKYHRSAGMDITMQRLTLLHKERGKKLIYQIVDKYSCDNIPEGTIVIFSIPYS